MTAGHVSVQLMHDPAMGIFEQQNTIILNPFTFLHPEDNTSSSSKLNFLFYYRSLLDLASFSVLKNTTHRIRHGLNQALLLSP